MTSTACKAEEVIYIGGYNCQKREKEVKKILKDELDLIRKANIHKNIKDSGKQGNTTTKKKRTTEHDDLKDTSLEGLERNVERLRKKVEDYFSPNLHFTKQYRTLIGYCGKYQTDLDKVDVKDNEEMRLRRKECLKLLDNFVDTLAAKAHPDGKICKDCEIKE